MKGMNKYMDQPFTVGFYGVDEQEDKKYLAYCREYFTSKKLEGKLMLLATKEEINKRWEKLNILMIKLSKEDVSGIHIKNYLQAKHIPLPIIFWAGHDGKIKYAFGKYVYEYLCYPIEKERLFFCMDSIIFEQKGYIMVNIGTTRKKYYLASNQINFILVEEVYTRIFTISNESFLVRKSLSYWEKILKPYFFCRIGKSVLINSNQVKGIDIKGNVIMTNQVKFSVGRRRKKELYDQFQQISTVNNILLEE